MLIQCKSCNVSFDDSLGRCIACGEAIVLSKEELHEQGILLAREWFGQGKKRKEIHQRLTTETSCSEREADEVIKTVKELRREAARREGRQTATVGLFFMEFFSVLTMVSVIFIGFFIGAAALFLGGIFTSITGWATTGDRND